MDDDGLKHQVSQLTNELDILEARRTRLSIIIHDKRIKLNRLNELLEIKGITI